MYRLKKNGAEVALVNEMQFVRMQDNGAYGSSGQLQADGVAADNQVFLFPGDVDTVEYVDGAAAIDEAIADTEAAFAILQGVEE